MSYFTFTSIHRDNIYFDRYETNKNPDVKTHFQKKQFLINGVKNMQVYSPLIDLFDLFVNLFN